jgi:hypothetical protein
MIGIDPHYYLDEMSQDEVVAVMKARFDDYQLSSRENWEKTRLQCFYSATAFGGKIKKPKDLFRFPWDVKPVETVSKTEALKRLQDMRKNRANGRKES